MGHDAGGDRRRVLLLGANGQVGWELRHALAPLGELTAPDRSTLDLANLDAVRRTVDRVSPAIIVNAAAYTQVDRAEAEPALAQLTNADAPAVLARAAAESGALLIHYSTDYVFDGAASRPYREHDAPNPINAYGRSKWDGDRAVLASGANAYIFRIGWVYGMRGRNFLRTVQRLVAEGKPLRIVSDQWGAPTWSRAIANATASAIDRVLGAGSAAAPPRGVYHMSAPDHTTWAGFARAIVEETMPTASRPRIDEITTAEFLTPATRPRWSVLASRQLGIDFGVRLPPWRAQLAACVASTASGGVDG